jgi:hypothetical protein
MTRPSIPIKAIAVWDTVGTLGVPELHVLGLKLFSSNHKEYSFIDTEVPPNFEYAYQALALDEARKSFSPTVWESPKPGSQPSLKLLRQCWFPGVHSSVGGGYADTSIADITLAWMITQLSRHLTFDPAYVPLQQQQNVAYYKDSGIPARSWAMGQIQKTDGGLLNTILGRQTRTPGEYHATDPDTGKELPRFLTDTCEFMHPSVRYRIQQKGPGLAKSSSDPGQGTYQPAALKNWEYVEAGKSLESVEGLSGVQDVRRWDEYGKWIVRRSDGKTTFIVEEKIGSGTEEMVLLDAWPGVAQKVLGS